MTRSVSFVAAAILCACALPAHAVSNPDTAVNRINATFRPTASSNGAIGGGGGSTPGTGVGTVCSSSPENPTVLLALLSGAGLLIGSRMRRVRVARVAIS